MSTINYTYNVIVDRFRQFAAGHFQLRRFTHGEISQADLEKEAEWPWLHVKPRAINYAPGTRSFSFEIFISDLPRDKEDKTGYQAESITDCSLIFQDLINEIYLGNMFGDQVVLSRPVNSEPFVEQYTHTLTGVTGTIELNLDYDWSACSIPASWNYNTPTDSPSDGWGALQFIESLDQNGVFVSLDGDVEAPGNGYYYGTNASGIKGWYQLIDNVGITCEDLPECATIISIVDDISSLQSDMLLKANTADLGAVAFSNDYNDLDNKPTIPAAQVNSDWNATSGVAEILNKPSLPATVGDMLKSVYDTDVDGVVDSAERIQIVVRNSTGSTLTKGQIVYLSGATGNRPNAVLAQANTEATSSKTIGMVIANIANNADGQVAVNGTLHDLDTSAFTAGDTLWLSATTAGGMVANTPPSERNHAVFIGYVARSHPNLGRIVLAIQNGYELDELHGVLITTPANNDVLTYESSTSLWKNKAFSTGLTVGTTPITSGAVGRVLFEGTGNVLQESANLFWDNTNSRLGVLISTPITAVDFRSSNAQAITPLATVPNAGTTMLIGATGTNGVLALGQSNTGNSWLQGRSRLGDGSSCPILLNPLGGNVAIGTTTDAGFKLDVNGTARVVGALSTDRIQNASNNTWIEVLGSTGIASNEASIYLGLRTSSNYTNTSGTRQGANMIYSFAPTSGTAIHTGFQITPTINQTGGANGITRGLYINPTLTAAADFRAIEVASGTTVLAPSVTARASLRIPSGTAPTSPVNGDIWFDGTNIKMQIGGVTKTFTLL